jgi:formylglycine-generating enzyme required for sulfatase activity
MGLSVSLLAATDPDYYRKRGTWQETLLDSLTALARAELSDGFAPFESAALRGGPGGQTVDIPLGSARDLYLFATGCPDKRWGVADWAEARWVSAGGQVEWLDETKNYKILLGRLERNLTLKSGLYQKMSLGDRVFERGLNVQADSVVRVPLTATGGHFQAVIGVDGWAGTNGQVRFSVVGERTAAGKRLWELLGRDFAEGLPRRQQRWEQEDRLFEFIWEPGDYRTLARRYAEAADRVPPLRTQALALANQARNQADLARVRELYYESRTMAQAVAFLHQAPFGPLQLAIEDLSRRFSDRYPARYLKELARLRTEAGRWQSEFRGQRLADYQAALGLQQRCSALKQEALLANPLLDFDRLLVIKRKPTGEPRRSQWEDKGLGVYLGMPQQSSWAQGTMVNVDQWENEIAVVSPVRPTGRMTRLFKPSGKQLVTDVDLNWEADKMLFAMPDQGRLWQVFELRADGSQLRQLTPVEPRDVHNYDPCYLPNGKIDFVSTAPLQGVPCNAGVIVGMMYQMEGDGRGIRQLCFEQDHDYNPTVLNNGRVLYLRWDYTDTPHVWNRVLMSMNPDGTGQMEHYGANSYWPNAVFFSRAVPGHPTKFAGIVTGHHEGRVGDLVVFDPALGRQETSGVVQRIPFRGQPVQAGIEDKLTEHHWPKFLHPWPLDENYFLVAAKPDPDSLWGIYLVDVFDNMTLIKEEEGFALLEPIPFRARPRPPVIQDKTVPSKNDALVYMEDVYAGPGLAGVPRGTIKNLRIFTYHFGYQTLAGIDHRVGADGPWEAKRVLGTVPVEADGSALFTVPAKTPLSFQPLDAEGRAVALMRSWMTAMPGENASCVGCHDRQSGAPPGANRRQALLRQPSTIKPWLGSVRGFSFVREVQPVLDKFCVGCHDGQPKADGVKLADLRRDQGGYYVCAGGQLDGQFKAGEKRALLGRFGAVFEPSYAVLRQYVRVGGLESDLHLLPPMEFHADTSELVRMLKQGHHGVALDAEAWERLVTWIDLNAPCHGTWGEVTRLPGQQRERRLELRQLYGGVVEDYEVAPEPVPAPIPVVMPPPVSPVRHDKPTLAGWPLTAAQAQQLQTAAGTLTRMVDLGGGATMEFVRVPAGSFVMGDPQGALDEQPVSVVTIEKSFWMSKFEVSNQEFARFNAAHDSRFEHRSSWIFDESYLGWPLNRPRQPVVRVAWLEAREFCRWLGARLGEAVNLPTEAQWEWACRAGSDSAFSYGDLTTDFSPFANLGDASLRRLADEGWRPKSPDLVVRENRFNDGQLVTADVGSFKPNAWGLHDLHGNAAEWTRSEYRPYPYQAADGRESLDSGARRVARGGSWRDRLRYARSAVRLAYQPWQKVFNVGFRVVIEPEAKTVAGR